jgi:DNA-binding transcriptional MocR family regulator
MARKPVLSEFERAELLPTKLAGYLRAEIVAGRLKPGDRLIEQAIAETCGVSLVPLREAMRILATEGLIVISPHRGASVNLLSDAELVGAVRCACGDRRIRRNECRDQATKICDNNDAQIMSEAAYWSFFYFSRC